ncbi:MAG: hypothetical protein QM831_33615 [Kofleriaceae bacterium]
MNSSPRLRLVVAPAVRPAFVTVALEQDILSELDRPQAGERFAVWFQRKEYAIGTLFAQLSVEDARVLHKRLAVPVAGDPIAERFAKLVVERQRRLLAFLGDARRRNARGTTR